MYVGSDNVFRTLFSRSKNTATAVGLVSHG